MYGPLGSYRDKLSVLIQPGYIQLAQSSAKIQRTGVTKSIRIAYGHIKAMHAFEVMKLPDPNHYKMLLGMDILPHLGIYITGIINPLIPEEANWESLLKKYEEDDEEEEPGFRESLEKELQENGKIPMNAHCNLEGSTVQLPIQDIDVSKIRSAKVNFVPPKYIEQTDENVKEWLKGNHIYARTQPTQVILPLLSTGEFDQTGLLKKVRTCLDLREVSYRYEQDKFQLPKIKEVLHHLAGCEYFTCLD